MFTEVKVHSILSFREEGSLRPLLSVVCDPLCLGLNVRLTSVTHFHTQECVATKTIIKVIALCMFTQDFPPEDATVIL